MLCCMVLYMYVHRWIHNWPQGSCSPIASALSALPFFQYTATVCGGPSPEGRTCTMTSGALLLCIIIIILYDLCSGNRTNSRELWLSCKAPREYQAFSYSHGWGWIWTNGMNHYTTDSYIDAPSLDSNLLIFASGKDASNCTHSS